MIVWFFSNAIVLGVIGIRQFIDFDSYRLLCLNVLFKYQVSVIYNDIYMKSGFERIRKLAYNRLLPGAFYFRYKIFEVRLSLIPRLA